MLSRVFFWLTLMVRIKLNHYEVVPYFISFLISPFYSKGDSNFNTGGNNYDGSEYYCNKFRASFKKVSFIHSIAHSPKVKGY